MARLWTAGAESKDATVESATLAGTVPTYDTGTVRSGAVAWKCNPAGSAQSTISHVVTEALGTTYYLRTFFRSPDWTNFGATPIPVLGNATNYNIGVGNSGTSALASLRFGTTVIGSSTTLLTNQWYRIELAWRLGTGALDYAEFKVEGVTIASETNANRTDTVNATLLAGVGTPGASAA